MSNENQLKQFEFAQEVVKQIIGLSTGVLTISIAFIKDIVAKDSMTHGIKILLTGSWVAFLVSILFGILALMALTGNVSNPSEEGAFSFNIRFFSGIQIVVFFIGILMTVIFSACVI